MNSLMEKAKKIRLVIFDVDGVLTNGGLIYGPPDTQYKEFHVHDGLGMQLLQRSGVNVAIITAKQSEVVTKRMQDLQITHVYQGQKNKLIAYNDLKSKLNLADEQIAYLGDDLPDLPVLIKVGLSATVADAPSIIQEHVTYCTKAQGGKGAARELCDMIMHAQNTYSAAIQPYLEDTI